ncbi:hypothetical protein Y032_0103g3560 [Ancylostoma ceylanicum]|uniref:Uncharacterized protein n=1 Tax=Ancylostoma ceylanicum TaxID=53326 RepID=A0A016TH17_9BILA|nr:hypothetical protein Y032_0103g3560 [Ancylostoma ceylanicum]
MKRTRERVQHLERNERKAGFPHKYSTTVAYETDYKTLLTVERKTAFFNGPQEPKKETNRRYATEDMLRNNAILVFEERTNPSNQVRMPYAEAPGKPALQREKKRKSADSAPIDSRANWNNTMRSRRHSHTGLALKTPSGHIKDFITASGVE